MYTGILFIEWAQAMTKYMGDLLQKMIEYYGGGQSPIGPGFLTTGNQIDIEKDKKQRAYCDRQSLHMYQVYLNSIYQICQTLWLLNSINL